MLLKIHNEFFQRGLYNQYLSYFLIDLSLQSLFDYLQLKLHNKTFVDMIDHLQIYSMSVLIDSFLF